MQEAKIDHIEYGGVNYEFVDQPARSDISSLKTRVNNINTDTKALVDAEQTRAEAAEMALQNTKVDRVAGKGLSTNDFTDEFKEAIQKPIVMRGATSTTDGSQGDVPKPLKADRDKFLKGDGSWAVPHDTTYTEATQTASGLMSGADKLKLDKLEDNPDDLAASQIVFSGSQITETLGNGRVKITTFNADGSITQVISKTGIPTVTLRTTFNADGSITRTREES